MKLGEARAPDGLRIYAIGDIHGCDDLLAETHAKVAADLAAYPCGSHRLVHVGDYVDRGPDIAAVVERLSRLGRMDQAIVCLRGNHEDMLLEFLVDPIANGDLWLMNGGDQTLASYGLEIAFGQVSDREMSVLGKAFAAALPQNHRIFFEQLPYAVQFGDFFFCHAGVRPGVALDAQDRYDLTWIREEFLFSDDDLGAVVVHGHTIVEAPEVRPNRINLDTGAVLEGELTCVALEGNTYRFL